MFWNSSWSLAETVSAAVKCFNLSMLNAAKTVWLVLPQKSDKMLVKVVSHIYVFVDSSIIFVAFRRNMFLTRCVLVRCNCTTPNLWPIHSSMHWMTSESNVLDGVLYLFIVSWINSSWFQVHKKVMSVQNIEWCHNSLELLSIAVERSQWMQVYQVLLSSTNEMAGPSCAVSKWLALVLGIICVVFYV